MVKGTAEKINVILSGQQFLRSPMAAAPRLRLSRLGRPSLPWPSASSSASGEGTKSLVSEWRGLQRGTQVPTDQVTGRPGRPRR